MKAMDMGNKALKRSGSQLVALPRDKYAVYIGSGPQENIAHLVSLVNADVYVLSDLDFSNSLEIKYADCKVIVTDEDGWKYIRKNPGAGFILLDRALIPGLKRILLSGIIVDGTYIYFHTMFKYDFNATRLGLVKIGDGLYMKKNTSSKSDVQVYRILEKAVSAIDSLGSADYAHPLGGNEVLDSYGRLVEDPVRIAHEAAGLVNVVREQLTDEEASVLDSAVRNALTMLKTRRDPVAKQVLDILNALK